MEIFKISANSSNSYFFIKDKTINNTKNPAKIIEAEKVINNLSFLGNYSVPNASCSQKLRAAKKVDGNIRFSAQEVDNLQKEIKRFQFEGSKSEILDKLLTIGKQYKNNQKLLTETDIVNYLSVMSKRSEYEHSTIMDIIEYEKTYENENNLYSTIFFHLTNCPELIKTLADTKKHISENYKYLPEAHKKEILVQIFSFASYKRNGEYQPHLLNLYQKVVEKLAADDTPLGYIEAVAEYSTEEHVQDVLSSLTENFKDFEN